MYRLRQSAKHLACLLFAITQLNLLDSGISFNAYVSNNALKGRVFVEFCGGHVRKVSRPSFWSVVVFCQFTKFKHRSGLDKSFHKLSYSPNPNLMLRRHSLVLSGSVEIEPIATHLSACHRPIFPDWNSVVPGSGASV
jgi:hypothetical protein